MESKLIYQKTKSVAEELTRIDLLSMFIVPIKEQDANKVHEVFEDFKEKNQSLWERFYEIYKIYNDDDETLIFDDLDCFDNDFSDEMCINLSILLILIKYDMKVLGEEADDVEVDELKSLKDLIDALKK